MNRILVVNFRASEIASVRKIAFNLAVCYEQSFENVEELVLMPMEMPNRSFLQELKDNPPSIVAVVHSEAVKHAYFKAMLSVLPKHVKIVFHLFGNFIRNISVWQSLEHHLLNRDVLFLAPSPTYQKVLKNFIPSVETAFFPMAEVPSSYEKEPGDKLRLLYAGRIHRQKNIPMLIQTLNEVSKEVPLELTIVGHFDDFNPSTIPSSQKLGRQYHDFKETRPMFNLQFHPHVEDEELNHYYINSDAFITFSTFFDDDFGFALLESFSFGNPCITSAWGGLKDFSRLGRHCHLIPVELEDAHFVLDTTHLKDIFRLILNRNEQDRHELVELVKNEFGIQKFKDVISPFFTMKKIFKGFSPELKSFDPGDRKYLKRVYRSFWEMR